MAWQAQILRERSPAAVEAWHECEHVTIRPRLPLACRSKRAARGGWQPNRFAARKRLASLGSSCPRLPARHANSSGPSARSWRDTRVPAKQGARDAALDSPSNGGARAEMARQAPHFIDDDYV